jgi:hypothetical protein
MILLELCYSSCYHLTSLARGGEFPLIPYARVYDATEGFGTVNFDYNTETSPSLSQPKLGLDGCVNFKVGTGRGLNVFDYSNCIVGAFHVDVRLITGMFFQRLAMARNNDLDAIDFLGHRHDVMCPAPQEVEKCGEREVMKMTRERKVRAHQMKTTSWILRGITK